MTELGACVRLEEFSNPRPPAIYKGARTQKDLTTPANRHYDTGTRTRARTRTRRRRLSRVNAIYFAVYHDLKERLSRFLTLHQRRLRLWLRPSSAGKMTRMATNRSKGGQPQPSRWSRKTLSAALATALAVAGVLLLAAFEAPLEKLDPLARFVSANAASLTWNHPASYPMGSAAQYVQSEANINDGAIVFGLGIGDVTGPIVQTNQMGYASMPQVNTGLHLRQFARAYIFTNVGTTKRSQRRGVKGIRRILQDARAKRLLGTIDDLRGALHGVFASGQDDLLDDPLDGQPNRVVYINTDICMGDTIVRRNLLDKLRAKYGDLYGEINVALAGTHSHAGVAGYHNNLLPTVTAGGIVNDTVNAIVDGSFAAVVRAHDDLARRLQTASSSPSTVTWSNISLKDAHINRSQFAYDLNPKAERDFWGSSQDDEMSQLTVRDGDAVRGFLNFYAVHGTSLYENNTLTSTDNKGLAAVLYEQAMEPDSLPGQNTFMAGFSQASVGDTSPNTLGPQCQFSGAECDLRHSTCEDFEGKHQPCLGRGPGWGDLDALAKSPTGSFDYLSNEVIAQKQMDAAKSLVDASKGAKPLVGPVRAIKLNVPMGNFTFNNGTHDVKTCTAALGYGFAGGTTDGPGPSLFRQGTNDTDDQGKNPLVGIVKNLYRKPSKEEKACHAPKEILLDIGRQNTPYSWSPGGPTGIAEMQLFRVGDFFILAVPTEMTTMAGRRLKSAVATELIRQGVTSSPHVVIGAIANTYTHYTATREEYATQRYEGSSTLFGPNQLDAYIYVYSKLLVPALREDEAGEALREEMKGKGKLTKNTLPGAFSFQKPVVYDTAPLFKHFGQVTRQPEKSYILKQNVTLTYVASNPRNNLRLGSSYFDIQHRRGDNDEWRTVRTDASPWTTMRWTQTNVVTGTSEVEVGWSVEKETGLQEGTYRFVVRGEAKKPVTGKIESWEGTSDEFEIRAA